MKKSSATKQKIRKAPFVVIFVFLALARSSLLDEIKDRETFKLAVIIFVALLALPLGRITLARPFAFGTIFLIYSTGQKGVIRGFLSSRPLLSISH